MRFGFSKGFQWVGKQKKHHPYSIRWTLNIIQINYYSILYFNTQSIQKTSMLIKYLVYVNGSNQRTTPKEITTWFPFSDISKPWNNPKDSKRGLGMARDIPAPNRRGSAPRQYVDMELTRQFPTYATSAAFFRMISDVHLLWVGHHKERLQDIFNGRTSTTLSTSKADIWKHVPMQIAVNQCIFLKLRFNKPTVCFLRRREVFYPVSGGSLIPALRSCSSIDLAHDPTCISRFEYIIFIIYIKIYSQKHYMYPKIPGLFGWCSFTQANPHLTGILIKYRTNI